MFLFSSLFLSQSVCLSVERGWMWHLRHDRSIKRNKPIKTVQKCPYLQLFNMLFHTVRIHIHTCFLRGISKGWMHFSFLYIAQAVFGIVYNNATLIIFAVCILCGMCSMQICRQWIKGPTFDKLCSTQNSTHCTVYCTSYHFQKVWGRLVHLFRGVF